MVEINRIMCGAFQNGVCVLAAGLVEYDNGRFEVMENGFSVYKGRNQRRAFDVYNNLCFAIQKTANNAGMIYHE